MWRSRYGPTPCLGVAMLPMSHCVLASRCQTLKKGLWGCKEPLNEGLPKGTHPGFWQLFGIGDKGGRQDVIGPPSALCSTSRLQVNPGCCFFLPPDQKKKVLPPGQGTKTQERGHDLGTDARHGGRGLRRQELIAAVAFIERSLRARRRTEQSTCLNSLHPYCDDINPSSLATLDMGKLRHKEVQQLFLDHTVRGSHPDSLAPGPSS